MKIRLTESAALFAIPLFGYAMIYGYARGQSAHIKMSMGFERILEAQTILSFVLPAVGIVLVLSIILNGIRKLAAKAGPVSRVFFVVLTSGLVAMPFALVGPLQPRYTVTTLLCVLVVVLIWQLLAPWLKGGSKDYRKRLDAEWVPQTLKFSKNEKYVYSLFFFLGAVMLSELSGGFIASVRTEYGYYCSDKNFVVVRHYDDGLVIAPLSIENRSLSPKYKWVEISELQESICTGPIGPLRIL